MRGERSAGCGHAVACGIARTRHRCPGKRIVGYYASWGVRRGAPVSAIRGELLTHINYAFARVTPEGLAALGDPCVDIGECAAGVEDPNPVPGGNFEQLRLLKQRFPHLKVLISFGGWSGSRYFSDAAATPEARRRFVESALDLFIRQHPGVFDGIDIDWEYPCAAACRRTPPAPRTARTTRSS